MEAYWEGEGLRLIFVLALKDWSMQTSGLSSQCLWPFKTLVQH